MRQSFLYSVRVYFDLTYKSLCTCSVAGNLVANRFPAFRWSSKRRRDGVPDELGAIPKNPLHAVILCTCHIG